MLLFCLIEVHEAGTAKECLTIKVRLFFPPSLFLFLAQSIASLWIAGALKVANSTVYSGVKCDEILVLSGREAFTFPPTHAFSLTSKLIRVTLAHYCR